MTNRFAACFFAGCALAQGPATVAGIFDRQLKSSESEIVSLVEAMRRTR